jgi:hypothetical protein
MGAVLTRNGRPWLIAEMTLSSATTAGAAPYGGKVFRGVPTSQGERFSVEHVHIYRLTDSRISEQWVVPDDLGMMLKIGAIPTSG